MLHRLKTPTLLALLVALLVAGIASAHADFVRSDPAPGSTLDVAPAQVTVWFTEAIEPGFSTITLLFEDGSTADRGDSLVSPADPTQLSVSLDGAREGTYVASWRVLSVVDGHITSGSFVFSVGKPLNRAVGGSAGGAVTSPLEMLARALGFVGQATLVGVMLFRWLVWRPALKSAELGEEVDDRAVARGRRIALIALGLAAAGATLTLFAQSALAGTTIGGWLGTRVGRVWIGRAATLVALAVLLDELASVGRSRPGQPSSRLATIALNLALGWLGLQLLFTTSLTSHSAAVASPPMIPMIADWLHLTATAVWAGGLAHMAFVVAPVARALDDEDRAWLWLKVVVFFSTVAAVGLGVLILTGTYMSMLHVGDWASLLGTVYGNALLFKLALAGAAMLLGAFNLFVVKPRLDRALDAPDAEPARAIQRRFRRVVTLEAVLALAALASAGILTNLPRSKDPQPVAEGGPLQLTTRAENLDAVLTIDPALAGDNTFDIRLSDAANGEPITDADEVTLRFTYLARSLGATGTKVTPASGGAYATNGAYLSLPGEWQIEVIVRRPDAFDAFAAYRVKVGLDGRIGPAGQTTVVESIARWLSIYGLAFGGGVAIVMGVIWLVIGSKAARNLASQALLAIPTLIALPIGALSLLTFFREATPGLALTNPYLPDEQSLATGQQLFEANCTPCHGPAGRGDGPLAASLNVRPPDYANGHLDIHTDGDIFYWIQNGLPPMPAFKSALNEDETWHLVNYVRRLRNLAGDAVTNAPQPVTTPSTGPQVFVTPDVGAAGPPALAQRGSGDPQALDLLTRADAAMNALKSLVEKQTLSDDSGNQIAVVFTYAAPDRLRYQIVNGATAIQIGVNDYQLGPDGEWIMNQRALPVNWPNFYYGRVAGGAQLDGAEDIGGAATTIVTFTYGGYDFRAWIDEQSSYILKLTMDGPNHHMQAAYSEFDRAPAIEPPTP
jgi:copper transport protein